MISEAELERVRQTSHLWEWVRRAGPSGDELTCQGLLLAVSAELVCLQQFESLSSEGIAFLRREDLLGCSRGETEKFRESVFRDLRIWDVSRSVLPALSDMSSLLAEFRRRAEFITVECEYEDATRYETFLVGVVSAVISDDDDQDVTLKCLSSSGKWFAEPSAVPIELISAVTWRDPYVEVLSQYVQAEIE